jgi:predicted transcriptional regulator
MAAKVSLDELSKRERQIMDIIYQLGKATAKQVMDRLPGSAKNATVRKLLSILVKKGFLKIEQEETNLYNRYFYVPTIPLEKARDGAIEHLLDTFFEGSTGRAMMALLKRSELDLTEEETMELRELIDKTREKGR